jgi:iron complex outermembrane receptor protein
MTNFLVGDRILLGDSWFALLGVNYATLDQRAGGTSTGISTSTFNQHKLTPSFGLTYKPGNAFSVYASYMQGLTAGGTAPATAANANQQLSPYVGQQYEIGTKTTMGKMDIDVALFRIEQINEYVDPSDNVYKQDGRQRHEGVELTMSGMIGSRLTVIGGGTLLNARVKRAANNKAIEGKIPLNVPEQQARLYVEYLVPAVNHLSVTVGVNYNGRRPVTATNTAFLPDATTSDAGARYQLNVGHHQLWLVLNVSNLLNKPYWVNFRSGDGLQLGTPRMIAASIKLKI